MKKKKLRPIGDILLDMEPLLQEAMDDHGLQHGDMLGIIHYYLLAHYPGARETYTDGSGHPVLFYGPEDMLPKKDVAGRAKDIIDLFIERKIYQNKSAVISAALEKLLVSRLEEESEIVDSFSYIEPEIQELQIKSANKPPKKGAKNVKKK